MKPGNDLLLSGFVYLRACVSGSFQGPGSRRQVFRFQGL
jgi:hypothetical protein